MIWRLLKKDVLRLIKQPWGFLLLSAIPIFLAFLMSTIFQNSGESVEFKIKLAIEDHDETFISELVAGAFQRGQLGDMFDVQKMDGGGVELVEQDEVSALLVIPQGFSDSLLLEKPISLTLIKNPSQAFGPKIVQEVVTILAEGGDRLLRIGAEPLEVLREQLSGDSETSDEQVAAMAIKINQIMNKAGSLLFDPPISLSETSLAVKSTSNTTNATFAVFLSGMVCMTVLFLLNGLAVDFFREKEGFTLFRILVTPAGRLGYFFAKFIYLASTALLSFILVWILGFTIWDIPLGLEQILPFLFYAILFVLASTAVVVFLYSLLKTRGQASAATPAIIIVLSIVGGGMVPLDALPGFMKQFAFISPVYWGADGLQELIVLQQPLSTLQTHMMVLLLITFCFAAVALLLQRRQMV